jgi:hypothetical protein
MRQLIIRQSRFEEREGSDNFIQYSGDASPSIDAAKKIADALEVSLDYLDGEGSNATVDKATVKRMQDIQKSSAQEKERLYAMLDALLLKALKKTRH